MGRIFVTLGALLALWAIPAGAAAQQAPPPDSEVDQYFPTYPGAKGDRGLGGGGGKDAGGGGLAEPDPVPAATQEVLRSQGPAGEAAADFAEGTAPDVDKSGKIGKAKGGKTDGGSSAGAAVGAATGGASGGGMGVWFPLLLAAIVAGGILYTLWRRGVLGSLGSRGSE